MSSFILGLLTVLFLFLILLVFLRKLSLSFLYLTLKETGKECNPFRFFSNSLNAKEKERRNQALLLFPLLYGVPKEEESTELDRIKDSIRRMHFLLYFLLFLVVLVGLMSKPLESQ
jgi:hypothetical protein